MLPLVAAKRLAKLRAAEAARPLELPERPEETAPSTEPLRLDLLEEVFTRAELAGIPASPLQLTIVRAAQGRPANDVLADGDLQRYFGIKRIPEGLVPRLVALICGVRSGKTFIAVCAAICASLTASLEGLQSHEIPRFVIIGDRIDTAKATFAVLCGILNASPHLQKFVEGEPSSDRVMLRREDGRRVQICVVAASRGGATVRNRWLVGYIIEEVAQIGVESTGAIVNAEEIVRAAKTRLLRGCTGWLISSPYGPQGLLYKTYKEHFGKPGKTLVAWAPTRAMNPTFPQETIDEIEAEDPDTAAREYGAEWVDAVTTLYPGILLDRVTREAPGAVLPDGDPRLRSPVAAGFDGATRGNAMTLAVAWSVPLPGYAPDLVDEDDDSDDAELEQDQGEDAPQEINRRVVVGGAWQWVGSKKAPLSPKLIFRRIARILKPYGVRELHCDAWSFDALQDHAQSVGLELVLQTKSEKDAGYSKTKAQLETPGGLELPRDDVLRTDLLGVKRKANAGGVRVELTKQPNGRHSDYAPSVTAAVRVAAAMGPLRIDEDEGDEDFEIEASRWEGYGGRAYG